MTTSPSARRGKWSVYLALGRVSNLPTVWSNVLVGVLLSGRAAPPGLLAILMAAMSLFYVGGMFLNDAFDRNVDARIHPERPIPSGEISAGEVFGVGFGAMGMGALLLAFVASASGQSAIPALASGLALGALIVLYDLWHKNNPIGPLLMGGCRMLVYVSAALAVSGSASGTVLGASLVLLSYLIGLTYVAKQETLSEFRNFWPLLFLLAPLGYAPAAGDVLSTVPLVLAASLLAWVVAAVLLLRARAPGNIPRAVVRLIAGISLVDGLLLAAHGGAAAALFGIACFVATLSLQRYVRGT